MSEWRKYALSAVTGVGWWTVVAAVDNGNRWEAHLGAALIWASTALRNRSSIPDPPPPAAGKEDTE